MRDCCRCGQRWSKTKDKNSLIQVTAGSASEQAPLQPKKRPPAAPASEHLGHSASSPSPPTKRQATERSTESTADLITPAATSANHSRQDGSLQGPYCCHRHTGTVVLHLEIQREGCIDEASEQHLQIVGCPTSDKHLHIATASRLMVPVESAPKAASPAAVAPRQQQAQQQAPGQFVSYTIQKTTSSKGNHALFWLQDAKGQHTLAVVVSLD